MKFLVNWFYALSLLFSAGCSTPQIIRNSEYKNSEAAFRSGDIDQAINRFPKKEHGGFVTSVEKSYLGYWIGNQDNSELMKQVITLDQRRYTSISKEAQYFFYSESEDGYIPAENEIIIMHLLNSMLFMRQEKWTEASVEARQATFYLQNYFREDQDHFDDPALRIWLSGIWAALGEWQEAQVDLRKAYELSGNKALLPLLEMTQAPPNYSVVFTGAGPEVSWRNGEMHPTFINFTSAPDYKIRFETMPWYRRHLIRNTQIRDLVVKSNYMSQYYGLNTSVTTEKSAGFVAANALRTTGVIVGTTIIVGGFLVLSQNGVNLPADGALLLVAAGFLPGTYLWEKGNEVERETDLYTKEHLEAGLENLKTYRFVRYMPSWISVTDQSIIQSAINNVTTIKAPASKTKVSFILEY